MTDEYKREAVLPDNSLVSSKHKPGAKWMVRGLILIVLGLLGWIMGTLVWGYLEYKMAFFQNPDLQTLFDLWNNPNRRGLLILEFVTVALLLVGAIGLIFLFVGIAQWTKAVINRIAAFIQSEPTQKKVTSFLNTLGKILKNAGSARHRLPFDEELRRLSKLKNEGHITEAEFEEAKKKILARIE